MGIQYLHSSPISSLQYFPKGCGFKQWTGDDSKALMKVYLLSIESHVPTDMVHTVHDLLDFCYLVRHNIIDTNILDAIDKTVESFHKHHEVFIHTGVCENWNLPCMNALKCFVWLIEKYGAHNALCSLMTENKHIKTVKEPWHRSSCYEALLQMFTTNTCLEKPAMSCVNFKQ